MLTIWKHVLSIADEQRIAIPATAKVLSVGSWCGVICVWSEVESNHAVDSGRKICIVGTGNPVPTDADKGTRIRFIGTVQQGHFVWHVYEHQPKSLGE